MPRYYLKHASPRMKYQHMQRVIEEKEQRTQAALDYVDPLCPKCGEPMGARPFFMLRKYTICYSCYYEIKQQGIDPSEEYSVKG